MEPSTKHSSKVHYFSRNYSDMGDVKYRWFLIGQWCAWYRRFVQGVLTYRPHSVVLLSCIGRNDDEFFIIFVSM